MQFHRNAEPVRVIAKPVVSGGTNEMVATRPAIEKTESSGSPISEENGDIGPNLGVAPPNDAAVTATPAPPTEGLARENVASDRTEGSVPPFVALMYSSTSRVTAQTAEAETVSRPDPSGRTRTMRSVRLATDREVLHPAWFEALPASLDDLRSEDGATTEPTRLAKRVQETPISFSPHLPTASRPARPRMALPGSAWPWWGWAVYTATIGVVVFAALYVAALGRLLLPRTQGFWAFRTRQAAGEYLLSVTAACLFATGIWVVAQPAFSHEIDYALSAPAVELTPTLTPEGSVIDTGPSMNATSTVPVDSNDADLPLALGGVAEVMALGPTGTDLDAVNDVAEVLQASIPSTDVTSPAEQVAEAAPPVAQAQARVSQAPGAATGMSRVVVANTGGRGVAFRNSPQWDDRSVPKVAFREGTSLTIVTPGIVGDDGSGGKGNWLMVRDSVGRTGYVPARFTTAR